METGVDNAGGVMKIGLDVLLLDMDAFGDRRARGRAPRYPEVREMALQAEAAGFDSLWFYDHLLYRFAGQPTVGIWECWTMLSALAEATQRVELGTLVLCTQFRHPALVAKMASTLDEVSNGRFILGVGAGWHEPEFTAFGTPFQHRVARFEEALQILRPLLKEGQVNFTGTYYQARDCEITPRGPRVSGPPLLVGGSGPRMLRLTAQYADLWNTAYRSSPSSIVEPRAQLHAACTAVGRDPATLGVTVHVAVAYPEVGAPPSVLSAFVPEYLTGSPEEIAAAMQGYEQMGVSHLICLCTPYNATTLGRLAEAVQVYRRMRSGN
jgi:probable F420-dependent oxidoreductase